MYYLYIFYVPYYQFYCLLILNPKLIERPGRHYNYKLVNTFDSFLSLILQMNFMLKISLQRKLIIFSFFLYSMSSFFYILFAMVFLISWHAVKIYLFIFGPFNIIQALGSILCLSERKGRVTGNSNKSINFHELNLLCKAKWLGSLACPKISLNKYFMTNSHFKFV
jgi:hypothetical protein